MYVCVCNTISDRRIREAVAAGADNFEALQQELGVSTCCGCCESEVRELLGEQSRTANPARHRQPALVGPPLYHPA